VLRRLPLYERSRQVKIVIVCFALRNYLLHRGHIGGSGSNSHGQVDYDVSDWVSANASQEMTLMRDWIVTGVSLM
jgi:CRISPR/Cas system CSM-associated protein Csm3 (group 7 of RAMP superfamily)